LGNQEFGISFPIKTDTIQNPSVLPAMSDKLPLSDMPKRPPAALVVAPRADLAAVVESARRYASKNVAEATKRAYASDWKAFEAWCRTKGLASLPSPPAVIAVYLAALADQGRKVSTIERALAGIAWGQQQGGVDWRKGHPQIVEVMKGIRRQLGTARAKKAPVEDEALTRMIESLSVPTSLHADTALRDRAILTLGWFGAFRRSELAALHVDDVEFVSKGMDVHIRRSKTDQEGRGRIVSILYASTPSVCAVRTLREWIKVAKPKDSLFDIGPRTVARIVQRTAEAVGLDPERFGGHSLRAGFATTASRKGKSLDAIMRQTGHKTEKVAREYIRHGSRFDNNATDGIL
jgi:integrase